MHWFVCSHSVVLNKAHTQMHLNLRHSFLWRYKHMCLTRQSIVLVSFHTFFAFILTDNWSIGKRLLDFNLATKMHTGRLRSHWIRLECHVLTCSASSQDAYRAATMAIASLIPRPGLASCRLRYGKAGKPWHLFSHEHDKSAKYVWRVTWYLGSFCSSESCTPTHN